MIKAAALEYAGHRIRINAVYPTIGRSEMTRELLAEGAAEFYESLHPLGRTYLPDEVAAVVEWLCSDESSSVTGTAMPIDGGLLARVM